MGATAVFAVLGSEWHVMRDRGAILRDQPHAPLVMITVHPSAILRAPDEAERRVAMNRFVDDLAGVRAALDAMGAP
jgi:DNA polymerase